MDLNKLLKEKVLKDLKDNIGLFVDKGKLKVVNMVHLTFSDEVENSFFASADTEKKDTKVCIPLGTADCDYTWFVDEDKKIMFNVDSYPEELAQPITKGINASRNIFSSLKKDGHIIYQENELTILSSEEIEKLLGKSIDLLESAQKDLDAQIAKYKSLNGSMDLCSFIDRYWFKKHLLIQGEKGL